MVDHHSFDADRAAVTGPSLRSRTAIAFAGFLVGFTIAAVSAQPVWSPEPTKTVVWVQAALGGVNMAAAFLRVARFREVVIRKEIVTFAIVVVCTAMVPWFRSPFGGYIPLGAAYVNPDFADLSPVLAAHFTIAVAVTIAIVIIGQFYDALGRGRREGRNEETGRAN